MSLSLQPPASEDMRELLEFETRNRAYFESTINARPSDYYSEHGVARAISLAAEEASAGTGFQYLVREASGALVGRVNLGRIRGAHFHSAELGYRIGREAAGRGYATEAVRLVLGKAHGEHGLIRIEATARPENAASVKVLGRNGFVQYGRSSRSFELDGVWYDLLHFERRTDA